MRVRVRRASSWRAISGEGCCAGILSCGLLPCAAKQKSHEQLYPRTGGYIYSHRVNPTLVDGFDGFDSFLFLLDEAKRRIWWPAPILLHT